MQIDAPETDRANVPLHLPDLGPLPAVICWVKGNEAGLSFNDDIAFEGLVRSIHLRRELALTV